MQADLEVTSAPSPEAGANQLSPAPKPTSARRYLVALVGIVLALALVSIDQTKAINESTAPSDVVMAAELADRERLAEVERKKYLDRAVEEAKDKLKKYLLWTVFGSAVSADASTSVPPEVLEASQIAWCSNESEIKVATGDAGVVVLEQLCPKGKAAEGVATLVRLAGEGNIHAATAIAFLQVIENPWDSLDWANRSAAKGVPSAYYLLGYHYQWGKAVPKDTQQSLVWHRRAAELGDIRSQNSLCIIRQEFDDPKALFVEPVYRSNIEAHAWCSLAASNPSDGFYAGSYRQAAASDREKIARALKPSQLAASMKRLRQLQTKFKALGPV